MPLLRLFLFLSISLNSTAQTKAPYRLYDHKGKKVSYKKMLHHLSKAQIILFGELHNNATAHRLEYKIASDLSQEYHLMLGAETFETDNQRSLNDYLSDKIDEKTMGSTINLWPDYYTDYKPLVELAKKNNIPFTATNVPRKYASLVFKKGFSALDSLPETEKKLMADIPIPYDSDLPSYNAMLKMIPGHGSKNFPKAQTIKDAAVAHFILKTLKDNSLFIHYNGSPHSNNHEGIGWCLRKKDPFLIIETINIVA